MLNQKSKQPRPRNEVATNERNHFDRASQPACPVALMSCPAPSNSQVENRQWTRIDANQKQDLSSRTYYRTAPFACIGVHSRLTLNSYGADGSLKTRIANQIFSREPKSERKQATQT